MILFTNVSDSSKCLFTDKGKISITIFSATTKDPPVKHKSCVYYLIFK